MARLLQAALDVKIIRTVWSFVQRFCRAVGCEQCNVYLIQEWYDHSVEREQQNINDWYWSTGAQCYFRNGYILLKSAACLTDKADRILAFL